MNKKVILVALLLGAFLQAPAGAQPAAGAAPSTSIGGFAEEGVAAWYGRKFAGRRTASGKRFNPEAMTAAHPSLPFGARVRVTNLENDRQVVVTINDRGPTTPGRIVDLSLGAARKLGMVRKGIADVRLEGLD
ncbi:MAG: septal ring lytic transglycosylase RlpA family protein [Rhodocyclaceae bacterium]|nr:septal ring lytic transglycosylase RlpA family protein [Rhodocyclaceae bacterium]